MDNIFFSVFFKFLFFFVLGSLISFLADSWGKKIGKKKIVIFNLRPRYTAVIITSLAGGIIALVSILFLSFLSKDARIYLFEMNKIIYQIDFYKNEVKILQQRYSELTRDISILVQTTHMGDVIFLKNQPIYIYSFYNDGSINYLYNAIDKVKKMIADRYKIKESFEKIVRIDIKEIANLSKDLQNRKNKRIALIFYSKRNTFIGEYVDIGISDIEDKVIIPSNTILDQVEIYNPDDIEQNLQLVMQSISKIQNDLISKGKLFLPQEGSIGGKIPFEKIVNELIRIKERSLTKSKGKFKILLINENDIYTAGSFNILLKTIIE